MKLFLVALSTMVSVAVTALPCDVVSFADDQCTGMGSVVDEVGQCVFNELCGSGSRRNLREDHESSRNLDACTECQLQYCHLGPNFCIAFCGDICNRRSLEAPEEPEETTAAETAQRKLYHIPEDLAAMGMNYVSLAACDPASIASSLGLTIPSGCEISTVSNKYQGYNDDGTECCSQDFKTCLSGWCNEANNCGSCSGVWMVPQTDDNCLAKWGQCDFDTGDCCQTPSENIVCENYGNPHWGGHCK